MKGLFQLLLIFLPLASFAQPHYYTDPRDGNRYEVVRLGNRTWFREHLRYRTSLSYYSPRMRDTAGLSTGNYYAMQELDTVCPQGWHVATIDEMEAYIQWIAFTHQVPDSSVIRSISPDIDSSMRIVVGTVNPYTDTLMRWVGKGWVQGSRQQRKEAITIWLRDMKKGDAKFHAHIGVLGYIIHTHEHNIIDKPRLVRRFNVRCVCDAQAIE